MKRSVSFRSMMALVLCLAMVLSFVPVQTKAASVDNFDTTAFDGLKLSILGDSISTFEGVSNSTSYNSTLGDNIVYYWKNDAQGTGVDVQSETWWQQTMDALGMSLCVNNSYSGSCMASSYNGDPAAYVDRCVQLHNKSGVTPDIIAFYMGTNDCKNLTSTSTMGTVDGAKKMTASSTPSTILEAYSVMLQKSMAKYPKAEFYCFTLLPQQNEEFNSNKAAYKAFNEGVAALAEYYGAYVVDLYNDSGVHTDKLSRQQFLANDLHPNVAGMTAISNCFISALMENSKYVSEDTCKVRYDLTNVYVEGGDVTTVIKGKPFSVKLAGNGEIDITVTMDGKDITEAAVSGNTVSIDKVTGGVIITATELDNFYWAANSKGLLSGSAFDATYTYNNLTKLSGTYSGATFNSTGVTFQMEKPINLLHDRPWVLEFEASGSWTSGSFLFSYDSDSAVKTNTYLFRTSTDGMLVLGMRSGSGYEHYGVGLTSDVKITASDTHVYRLENRINEDGSNMVYLTVDGGTPYAMNNHYDATTDTGTTAGELSGRDLTFRYMGTTSHPLRNGTLNWVKVYENGEPAKAPAYQYRWEAAASGLKSVENETYRENVATLTAGTAANGVMSNAIFALDETVDLLHDSCWNVTWRAKGTWDGMLLSNGNISAAYYAPYLLANARGNYSLGWNDPATVTYLNYGVDVSVTDDYHVYTLQNEVTFLEDGSYGDNMVYLYVDGTKVGPMTTCYPNGNADGKTSTALAGKDLSFNGFGRVNFGLSDVTLDYLEVNTGCTHNYKQTKVDATCTSFGYMDYTCTRCGDSYREYEGLEYSDWQSAKPDMDEALIESKVQYRASRYETTTSFDSTLQGYENLGSEWVVSGTGTVSYVNSWPVGFDTSSTLYKQYNKLSYKVSASENASSRTVIESDDVAGYLYYHWCYANSYYSQSTKTGSYTTFHAYYSTVDPSTYTCDYSDMSYRTAHSTCSNSEWFFVTEVYAQNYTNYRLQYNYGRWGTLSDWSDTPIEETETCKVETKTLYRYVIGGYGGHDYTTAVTEPGCATPGATVYTCSLCSDSYSEPIPALGHSYQNDKCTVCDAARQDFYLIGWINGADYGCESDWENLGQYKFVDGQVVATFTEDSYVFVKTGDNLNWYMSDGYAHDNEATLYNTNTGVYEKVYVPGGVVTTFTLTYGPGDVIHLSYVSSICVHKYDATVITPATCEEAGLTRYTCTKCGDSYDEETAALGHNYVRGTCTICGAVDENYTAPVYVLFGFINGQDYGSMDDYENRGEFRFEEGKLVATFSQDSYVAVKVEGNTAWYMTREYTESASAVLYNTNTGATEKMFIPAYKEITFTLTETENDTLTLSYTAIPCPHIYDDTITTEPGCETPGVMQRTCRICTYTTEAEAPAAGHKYQSKVTQPGCITNGYTTYTCTVCKQSYVDNATEATGHDYKSIVTVEPGCETSGEMLYECTKCDNSYTGQIGPSGHNYLPEVTKPTCTEKGYTTYTCDRCADSYIEDETSATGHAFSVVTSVIPGCENDGMTTHTCSKCGYTYDTVLEAVGHNYISEAVLPGCETEGYTLHECTICGNSYADTPVAATGHNYSGGKCTACGKVDPDVAPPSYYLFGWINESNYACEEDYENMGQYEFEDGKLTTVFQKDSYVGVKVEGNAAWYMTDGWQADATSVTLYNTGKLGESADKLFVPGGKLVTFTLVVNSDDTLTLSYTAVDCPHDYASEITKAPTCDKAGEATYTCKLCGNSYTDAVAATGHNYKIVITQPTCLAQGYTTYTCNTCGHSYVDKMVPATGHKTQSKVTVEPGCETAGVMTYTCTVCGYSYTGSIAATGHSYKSVVTKPTCTEKGYTTFTCTVCGDSYVGNETPAKNHDYESITTKDPTCEQSGEVVNTCKACGATYIDILDATGHSYRAEVVLATCTEDGYTIHTCTACGDSHTDTIVPAYGHHWSSFTEDATCDQPGSVTSTCTNCGDVTEEEIPAKGHVYDDTVLVQVTCESDGQVRRVCGVCGYSTTETVPATGHRYINGLCISCGAEKPDYEPVNYYLFGWINGGNYACEEDYESMGEYLFLNGHLTVTFAEDSYVAVKTEGNTAWYMTNGWQEGVTSVTLYNTVNLGEGADKLFVPGNLTVTFTLTENSDGTLNLSYAQCDCQHNYTETVDPDATCETDGLKTLTCTLCSYRYTEVIPATGHDYVMGICRNCGAADESYVAPNYYLFGWINGADYACEGDSANMGNYKFTDGKLVATFDSDSYVAVKAEGNTAWYMTDGWQEGATSVTLYNTNGLGENANKLFVPGGVEITFTLTENSNDGTLTLSYTKAEVKPSTVPTISMKYPSLSFEDVIIMNVYYLASDLEDVVEMGLITNTVKPDVVSIENADAVIPGYGVEGDFYFSSTAGIAPKDIGDTIYFAVYAKLADGTVTYTKMIGYSPKTYALNQLTTGSAEMRPLVAAMLNYGAAAQTYFNYKTDALVNATMTDEQKAMAEAYRADMIASYTQASGAKLGTFINDKTYSQRYPTITFEGAFCINYYFAPSLAVVGDVTMYVWSLEDFEAAEVLTKENATKAIKMELAENGEYTAVIDGIAAKDLDKVVYVTFVYSDGTTEHCGGVIGYTIGAYCKSQAAKTGALAELAKACAVYGYYAKQLFNK